MSKLDKILKDLNFLQDERINLSKNHRQISSTSDLEEVRKFLKAYERILDISKEIISKNTEAISLLPDGDNKKYLGKRLADNYHILKISQEQVFIFRAVEKRILNKSNKASDVN